MADDVLLIHFLPFKYPIFVTIDLQGVGALGIPIRYKPVHANGNQ